VADEESNQMARIGSLNVLTLAFTAGTLMTVLVIADAAHGGVDGDGDLDTVFANGFFDRNRVCLGDGSGGFTCSDLITGGQGTQGVAVGDVDGDGNADVVFAGGPSEVCLGDGSGGFICSGLSTDRLVSEGVAMGDVDGDGDLDAVFANFEGVFKVCLGDGSGVSPVAT